MLRMLVATIAIGLGMTGPLHGQAPQAPGHWPQWRGPNRDGISPETGLLKEWPEDGPPLLWKVEGIGTGNAPVSVAGGRIVSVGYRHMVEVVFALDGYGKELWATPFAPQRETFVMSWLSQRAPTVDDERVYAVSNMGELVCLESATGKLLWRKEYKKDFQGSGHPWGYCDYPLVDKDRLIVCPGGVQAAIVALNKKTGEVIWQATAPDKNNTADYSAVIVAEAAGVRQYVKMFREGLVSVSAADGKFLWRYDKVSSATLNIPTPTARGDLLHVAGGYGMGVALLRPSFKDDKAEVEELYLIKPSRLDRWSTGAIVLADQLHLNGSTLSCLDLKTAQVRFESERGQGSLAPVYADGHFYCRQENGKMLLLGIGDKQYQLRGSFRLERPKQAFLWTMPTIAGGRLYLRDMDVLLCYDIKAKLRSRGPRPPFVPTPQDVVEKMLELADVKKTDTVVDLGCGDGRIVVTAAQKYGCKAKGYDLDKECLRLARENVKKNQLQAQVQIIEEDIFNVDLSKVDVVTLYLFPSTNVKLIPQFEKMKPGSRIVSHAADMKGAVPDKVITVKSKDDEQERKLYLWTVPLKKQELSK